MPAAPMLKLLTRSKSTRRPDAEPIVIPNKRFSVVEPSALDLNLGPPPPPPVRKPSAKLREGMRHKLHANRRSHQLVICSTHAH
ncbi:unnamed protein product [Nesidiocoris tenuis]|uniref:Uncharacterized protein n=1 Tax=Nesidiocoris tenuis TaxID=355587 RepID=A0A6H5GLK3_9HEMI|nr:unnamed protein product [Nesidiocoris tenuis]